MPILATMFTITTYGTWLRGDERGWVDDGVTFPPDPVLEKCDNDRLVQAPFYFDSIERFAVGQAMGEALIERLKVDVLARAFRRWAERLWSGDDREMRERRGPMEVASGSAYLGGGIR